MLKVSIRRLFASNGLIDDIVIYGTPNDYKEFADALCACLPIAENKISFCVKSVVLQTQQIN